MKKRGFTLIELLAVIVLLTLVVALVYPSVITLLKNKDTEINESKKELLYTTVYDYLYENKGTYPLRTGKVYCVNVSYLASLNRLTLSDYEDIFIDNDVTNNYVKVQIGDDTKLYNIINNTSTCTDGVIEG